MSSSAPSVSRFRPSSSLKKPHIANQAVTWSNWHEHIAWINVIFVAGIPLFGIFSAFSTPLLLKTAIWAFVYYFMTGLGITAGYHRLWSHTSYTATLPIQIFLALVGGGAIQGSIRWWSRNHRAHHRYTDTVQDPYSVQKGLLYSHMGWMVLKQDPHRIGRVDITDLNNDPVVMWQHRNFVTIALSMSFLLPCVVAGLGWGDWKGIGDQPFDDRNSPRDHVITALVTLGEGYHNFHHEFPSDYRNAIQWHQYDPTKWSIFLWKQLGLASNLKTFPDNEIEKGRVQQLQKKIDRGRAELDWGVPLEELPLIEWDEFVVRAKEGEALVAVAGVVHDVGGFVKDHPGGMALISSAIGKDATAMFNGGVYNHLNAAHNLLSTMRIGVLRGGLEVEVWKRSQLSTKNV
ncbi:stearoyl-CoA 9-desaturase [Cadophora gregata]|uniref:stearoyl-CoA 9-desaturase n=1 Tax=Cadophora gregata TaxID=51156 RepID=UPI0026DB410E|nr:stearoyl-CoA 9-desaturase [Cadophora gregata]KAK0121895.1 stearoyl-CoA 9-desaturase [Cadophora gregata]